MNATSETYSTIDSARASLARQGATRIHHESDGGTIWETYLDADQNGVHVCSPLGEPVEVVYTHRPMPPSYWDGITIGQRVDARRVAARWNGAHGYTLEHAAFMAACILEDANYHELARIVHERAERDLGRANAKGGAA
jgi:hypothetical protein